MAAEIKASSSEEVTAGNVPNWMDCSFFQKALREGCKEPSIMVDHCHVWEALGKGENYVSIVYRANVKQDTGKHHHLIIKCMPSNEARKTFAIKTNCFQKESKMYKVVFPIYERLHDNANFSFPWPKHYFSVVSDDRDYLVLEDLKESGYVMRERVKGLDKNHLQACLSALGNYHAHSYALKFRDPAYFKKLVEYFPESLFNLEFKEMSETYTKAAYESVAQEVRKWGGHRSEMLAKKIEAIAASAFDEIAGLLHPVEPGALLTHGDFWINNMLFKYSNTEEAETGCGKPIDVKLLDFQLVRYGSVATDLVYFMVSCLTAKTRKEHWEYMLEHAYLTNFWSTLESLGHKGDVGEGLFTLCWIKEEIKKFQPFAFHTSVTLTSVITADSEEVPDLDTLTEEILLTENPFAHLAKGKLFLKRFRDLLDEFEEDGFFDRINC